MRATAIATVALLAAFVWALEVVAAPPDYDFTVTPAVPTAGEAAAFTATGLKRSDAVSWDFENDGVFDATGTVVQHVYPTSGQRIVRMRVTKDDGTVRDVLKPVSVQAPPPGPEPPAPEPPVVPPPVNQPPVASFVAFPQQPLTGDVVRFVSTSSDPQGPVASQAWDLDGDGSFDDATGPGAAAAFHFAGPHVVSLRVTDAGGLADVTSQTIVVLARATRAQPRLELMSPFPIIRIVGRARSTGAVIRMLAVRNAPPGATVAVRCRGRGCPLRVRIRSMPSGRTRLRPLERRLPAGVLIRIYVTQPGRIGKYTSFRIRRMRAPLRRDRCLIPGIAAPRRCPSS